MAPKRQPKRQRKKQAAAAKRQARVEAARRRQRTRRAVLVGVLVAMLAGGSALAFLVGPQDDETADLADTVPTPDPTPAPVACDAEVPPEADDEKPAFDAPEDQQLDPATTYLLQLDTSCGRVVIRLATEVAPQTVNSIVFLARQGFYDGLTFHRLVPGFVIQGGDPAGDGTGGPGYQVVEAPPEDLIYTPGMVAMAKAGPDDPGTSGSQLFIVTGPEAAELPPEFALLGEVVEGMDVAERISQVPTAEGPQQADPLERVFIERAAVVEEQAAPDQP